MLLLGKQLCRTDLSSMTCIKSAAPRAGSIIGTRHVSLGHGAACAVIIAALILLYCTYIIAGYRQAVRSWVTPYCKSAASPHPWHMKREPQAYVDFSNFNAGAFIVLLSTTYIACFLAFPLQK